MPFTKFAIPSKESEKLSKNEYKCNARIRINDEETYCDATSEYARCSEHNVGERTKAAREEARLSRIDDLASIEERRAELAKDKRNLTKLDDLILNSLATIQELEKRYPIGVVTPSEAVTIARLREKHAALVHQRVDLENKLKTLLDTDFIFEQAAELFEKKVVDSNDKKILLEGIGRILNDIVKAGKSTIEK